VSERAPTAVELDGVVYFPVGLVCHDLHLSRATLWRWRRDGKVPAGTLYRDRQVVFTSDEVDSIRRYANRLEPLGTRAPGNGNHERSTTTHTPTHTKSRRR
jgi:hypothetical protein